MRQFEPSEDADAEPAADTTRPGEVSAVSGEKTTSCLDGGVCGDFKHLTRDSQARARTYTHAHTHSISGCCCREEEEEKVTVVSVCRPEAAGFLCN